jgi:ribosomal protein L16 Arg81 hydroxylase
MATCSQELAPPVSALDTILSPMTTQDFIETYFGQSFLHLAGHKGKFSHFLPWSELNRILEEHRLAPPRLKLFRSGKEIDPVNYLRLPRSAEATIKAAEFTNLLGSGATLVVDEVDELYRPIRELALALERVFRVRVGVNLYAGWRTDEGFLLHYDHHDTVILQVAGRKHWLVYEPTRLYPLEQGRDTEEADKPSAKPIWDGIFEDGGLLYIPRGWWHVAFPVDEPTLHLTVGLHNSRGLDLLLWLANSLTKHPEIRQDIPHLSNHSLKQAYLAKLREHVLNAWNDNLVDRFMAASDGLAHPRPYLRLPEAATPDGIIILRQSEVRLMGSRRLNLSGKPEDGQVKFKCFGKTLRCPVAVLSAIERLNDGEPHSVLELLALTPDQDTTVINVLQALALQGVLTIVSGTTWGGREEFRETQ